MTYAVFLVLAFCCYFAIILNQCISQCHRRNRSRQKLCDQSRFWRELDPSVTCSGSCACGSLKHTVVSDIFNQVLWTLCELSSGFCDCVPELLHSIDF